MNVVILGGGIAGMLAAHVLRSHRPTIIEAGGKLGGNFLAGGLKYLHDTPAMRELLDDLDVPFKLYSPRGKLASGTSLLDYPDALRALPETERRHIQWLHWGKTRGTYSDMPDNCMNDPMGSHLALRCDLERFMDRLERAVTGNPAAIEVRLGAKVIAIGQPYPSDDDEGYGEGRNAVTCQAGAGGLIKFEYDALVPTVPLPLLSKLAPWANLPRPDVTKLLLVKFAVPEHQQDQWGDWDYIYTPRQRWISRLYWAQPDEIVAEVPAYLIQSEGIGVNASVAPPSDAVIAQVTLSVRDITHIDVIPLETKLIPGHLRPLEHKLVWPRTWHPLGRFAQWEPRATSDKVLDSALALKDTL